MKRNMWLLAVVCLIVLVLAVGCGGTQSSEQPADTGKESSAGSEQAPEQKPMSFEKVRLVYTDSIYSLTSIVAQEMGYFIEEGLAVNANPLPNGGYAVSGLVGKSADFSVGSYARFLTAVNEEFPIDTVGITGYGFQGSLVVPTDSDAATLADLKGKRLAVQMGSGTSSIFLRWLEAKGFTTDDFQIMNMDTEMIPATFESGDIDAGFPWDPFVSEIVAKGMGKVIVPCTEISTEVEATYAFPLMTRTDIIEERPEIVEKFCRAWVKAMKFIHENPDEAVEILLVAFRNQVGLSVSEDAVKNMVDTTYYDRSTFNEQDQQDALESGKAFVKAGYKLNKVPTLEQIKAHVDNSFMEKAEAELR